MCVRCVVGTIVCVYQPVVVAGKTLKNNRVAINVYKR